jgi:kynurenine formamidase
MESFMTKAMVLSIEPKLISNDVGQMDHVITLDQLNKFIPETGTESIIIRTITNDVSKQHMNYSATNPAYLDIACVEYFNRFGIRHLLIDTPSVDREEDGGVLAFHHAYWGVPDKLDFKRTITEMIFVKDEITDGHYILDLQVAPFENDASPSRPVLYRIHQMK